MYCKKKVHGNSSYLRLCISLGYLLYCQAESEVLRATSLEIDIATFLGNQELSELWIYVLPTVCVIAWDSLYSHDNFQHVFISTKTFLKGDKSDIKQVKAHPYPPATSPVKNGSENVERYLLCMKDALHDLNYYLWNSNLINLGFRYPLTSNMIFPLPQNSWYLYFRGVNRKACLFYSFHWFHLIHLFYFFEIDEHNSFICFSVDGRRTHYIDI